MKKLLKVNRSQQAGFSLLEILIALAITALVSAGIVMIITQIFQQNNRATAKMQAIQQVQNVAFWINRDALMTQTIPTATNSPFPLNLTWQGSDSSENDIAYNISGNKLIRSLTVTSINGTKSKQSSVAQNIDATKTNWSYAGGILTWQVTSTISGTSETRVYQIKLRVDQPS